MIPVIGISGKIGTGKTTLARKLANKCHGVILSFANALKQEAAERYRFKEIYTHTQEGKNMVIFHPDLPLGGATVREILQQYGNAKRQESADYWDNKIKEEIYHLARKGAGMVIIDDVRHPSECMMIRGEFGGYIIRLHPYAEWKEGPYGRHYSEIALDEFTGWDWAFWPEYGALAPVADQLVVEMYRRKMI